MLSRDSVGTYQGIKLTHNLSGNDWQQSSQLAEPLWTDPGIKSGISVCELISNSQQHQKCRQGMNGWKLSPNPHKGEKSHHRIPFELNWKAQGRKNTLWGAAKHPVAHFPTNSLNVQKTCISFGGKGGKWEGQILLPELWFKPINLLIKKSLHQPATKPL